MNGLRLVRVTTNGRPRKSSVVSRNGCMKRLWMATRTSAPRSVLGLRSCWIISLRGGEIAPRGAGGEELERHAAGDEDLIVLEPIVADGRDDDGLVVEQQRRALEQRFGRGDAAEQVAAGQVAVGGQVVGFLGGELFAVLVELAWQHEAGVDDLLRGGHDLLAAEQDVGLAVEARLHDRFLFAAEVLGIGGQVLADVRHDEFAVGGGEQADADRGQQHGPQHAEPRDAGGQEGGHFVVPLDPGDREHHGDEREHAAGAVEERDGAIGIVGAP